MKKFFLLEMCIVFVFSNKDSLAFANDALTYHLGGANLVNETQLNMDPYVIVDSEGRV